MKTLIRCRHRFVADINEQSSLIPTIMRMGTQKSFMHACPVTAGDFHLPVAMPPAHQASDCGRQQRASSRYGLHVD